MECCIQATFPLFIPTWGLEMNFLAWTPVPNKPTKDMVSTYSACWRWLHEDPNSTAVLQCVKYCRREKKEAWIAALHLRWRSSLTVIQSFIKMKQSEQIANSFKSMLEQGAPWSARWLDWCTWPNVVQPWQQAGAGAELGTHPDNASELLSGHTGNSHQLKQG